MKTIKESSITHHSSINAQKLLQVHCVRQIRYIQSSSFLPAFYKIFMKKENLNEEDNEPALMAHQTTSSQRQKVSNFKCQMASSLLNLIKFFI